MTTEEPAQQSGATVITVLPPAPRRSSKRLGVFVATVVLASGAGLVGFQSGALDRWLPDDAVVPTPLQAGLQVAAPQGVALPGQPAVQAPPGLAPSRADAAAVRRAIAPALRNKAMGKRYAVMVGDATGATLWQSGPRVVTPASTLKLLTGAAALDALGAQTRLETRVVRSAEGVVLVGAGDPLLLRRSSGPSQYPATADLATLAEQTVAALRLDGTRRVRLGYDASIFAGPRAAATWESDYLSDDVVSPISGLSADQGRTGPGQVSRSPDPARAAAVTFAAQLRARGIQVIGTAQPAAAPTNSTTIASARSAPVSTLVSHMLEFSDNEVAEALAHLVGANAGAATFAGGAQASLERLAGLGINLAGARVYDGSGLSRANRVPVSALLEVLGLGLTDPAFRDLISGLPVAGFNGTLAYRFETTPAQAMGVVRAKTGTLTGVSGYAGTVQTRDGTLLSFVAVADRIRPERSLDARAGLDQLAAALANCLCGATAEVTNGG